MLVKICGLTNYPDAKAAVQAGADMLGFIFYPPSPRSVTAEEAEKIIQMLRNQFGENLPALVGVFVNADVTEIHALLDMVGLDFAQLSGEEPPEDLIALGGRGYKAIRPASIEEARQQVAAYVPYGLEEAIYPAILVDSYHPNLRGGTGELAAPEVVSAIRALSPRLMLAGGLTPENVTEQIRQFRPLAVDVASGVEAEKGRKDHAKIQTFIQNAKSVEVLER